MNYRNCDSGGLAAGDAVIVTRIDRGRSSAFET